MIIFWDSTAHEITVSDVSYRYRAIMGENSLTLSFVLPTFTDIPIGAYCDFQGERYTLTAPQNFKKQGTRNFEYVLILDSAKTLLEKYKLRDTTSNRLKFSLTAKPHEHLQLLVDNLNQRDSGWTIGNYIDATEKGLSFNHNYCSEALQMMAEAWETEWEVVGKTIHLKKVEYNKIDPLALSYGRGNGFKPGVGRTNFDRSKPVEILFVQGGERNIDKSKYGASELLLPKNQQLIYEGRTYRVDADGLSIKRADKALATNEESSIDLSNIYPSRVGEVSSVDEVDPAKNFYDFIDISIPENLNFSDCIMAGETMTVIFQTGMLTGKEFDVKYIHVDKRFELVSQTIDGQTMPNAAFKPVIGDTYAVFGISLPDAYVCDNTTMTGGSWDLFREAVKYLFENEDPRFSFTGEMDGIWSKKNWSTISPKLKLGGFISFSDAQFQIEDVLIRITGIKDLINSPENPSIELSNVTVTGSISSDLRQIAADRVVTNDLVQKSIALAKRRFKDAEGKSIFHAFQGEYDPLKNYTGNTTKVDMVKYLGAYYTANVEAGIFTAKPPTNTVYWTPFNESIESIATGLLLAELAYIENLGVRYLKTGATGQRIEINGDDGSMVFYSATDPTTPILKLNADGVSLQGGSLAEGSAMQVEKGVISFSQAVDGDMFDLANRMVKIAATGIDISQALGGPVGHIRVSSFAGGAGTVEILGKQINFGSGNVLIDQKSISSQSITMLNGRRTPAEVAALPNCSIFLDGNGTLSFKDENGATHIFY